MLFCVWVPTHTRAHTLVWPAPSHAYGSAYGRTHGRCMGDGLGSPLGHRPSCCPYSWPSSRPSLHPSRRPDGHPSVREGVCLTGRAVSPSAQLTAQPADRPHAHSCRCTAVRPTRRSSARAHGQPVTKPDSRAHRRLASQPVTIRARTAGWLAQWMDVRPADHPPALPDGQPAGLSSIRLGSRTAVRSAIGAGMRSARLSGCASDLTAARWVGDTDWSPAHPLTGPCVQAVGHLRSWMAGRPSLQPLDRT
jgi:hypothetical protein